MNLLHQYTTDVKGQFPSLHKPAPSKVPPTNTHKQQPTWPRPPSLSPCLLLPAAFGAPCPAPGVLRAPGARVPAALAHPQPGAQEQAPKNRGRNRASCSRSPPSRPYRGLAATSASRSPAGEADPQPANRPTTVTSVRPYRRLPHPHCPLLLSLHNALARVAAGAHDVPPSATSPLRPQSPVSAGGCPRARDRGDAIVLPNHMPAGDLWLQRTPSTAGRIVQNMRSDVSHLSLMLRQASSVLS